MSQQDAAKQQANTRNNIRVVSIFTAAAIGLVGVLVILYAWQLPPFTRHSQFTDNAYVRGQTTFISPQVNGYITAVNVKDFAIVQPGEVLFQIDDRIYKQRVHQAQATLAMKEAALRNNLQQRKSAEATIAKNEAALQNARAQSAATGLPIHSTLYKGGLTASYDVDIWGANRSAASSAGASLEAQKAAAAAANLSVASSVAVGYVTLLSLDEQLRVTQQTLKSREDAWRLAKRQFETGYTLSLIHI